MQDFEASELSVPQVVETELDETKLESTTLARLLEEVRNEEPSEPHAYNRMHNRHNR